MHLLTLPDAYIIHRNALDLHLRNLSGTNDNDVSHGTTEQFAQEESIFIPFGEAIKGSYSSMDCMDRYIYKVETKRGKSSICNDGMFIDIYEIKLVSYVETSTSLVSI